MKRPGNLGEMFLFAGCGQPKHAFPVKVRPRSLSGYKRFGQTELEDIDAKIAQVEKQIAGLRKIIQAGSPGGKVAAQTKLEIAEKTLKDWYKKRIAAAKRA
jgi:hypothetical protein